MALEQDLAPAIDLAVQAWPRLAITFVRTLPPKTAGAKPQRKGRQK